MNKQEFIEQLRAALSGSVPPNVVIENVNFYEDYINTELRKGRNEAEILQELGSPRLIARTIRETSTGTGGSHGQQNSQYQGANVGRGADTEDYYNTEKKKTRVPSRLWVVVIILAVVVILGIVLSILSFLAPVIISVIVVFSLVKLFRDWLN